MTISPQPPASPALGTVRLTLQGNVMTSNMITPTVRINGYPVPAHYGVNDLAVYAGPTRVEVHAQWLREYGQAALEVVVPPGQVVPVFYVAPWHQFTTGSIGFEKQRRKGCLPMIAMLVALMAVIIGLPLLAITLS